MDERLVYWDLTTPDGTVMRSTQVHDYRTHTDANGKEYMVDGGNAYIRCSAHGDEAIFSITEADIPRIKGMQKRIEELEEALQGAYVVADHAGAEIRRLREENERLTRMLDLLGGDD